MQLIDSITIRHAFGSRLIKLYLGDLTAIPHGEAVDVLVVSAFPYNYVPTRTSLVGALDRKGVSLAALAEAKEVDLRNVFSCWLSHDLSREHPNLGFRKILCFEPQTRGSAPELVGDIFRSIMPFAMGEPPVRSIAMPILASGSQKYDLRVMMSALLHAAVHWLEHGLPLDVIKIVAFTEGEAALVQPVFAEHAAKTGTNGINDSEREPGDHGRITGSPRYDCFVSYAREDEAEVQTLVRTLKEVKPEAHIFLDKLEIKPGQSWQAELDEALESCRKVIAVYSPAYLQSKVCIEEFNMARLRHRESDTGVLVPIYLRTVPQLPLYMRSLNYVDCREGDTELLDSACRGVVAETLAR